MTTGANSPYRNRLRKLAKSYGWTFGWRSDHPILTKEGFAPIRCSGSPRNPDGALREVERDIRRRESGYYERGTDANETVSQAP